MTGPAVTKEERLLAEVDAILAKVSTRSLVPADEITDMLLDLRQLLDGYWIEVRT